ncbi:MAG TPA: hypothetical protein VGL83_07790 [Stellaceae bacterium]
MNRIVIAWVAGAISCIAGAAADAQTAGDEAQAPSAPPQSIGEITVTAKRIVEARADLINALDEVYLIRQQSGIGVNAPQYGPRRTFYLGVRKYF